MKVSISGHRPKYWNYNPKTTDRINNFLGNITSILYTMFDGELVYISGMAIGIDQLWASQAVKHGIPLHCYVPCKNQHQRWKDKNKELYKQLINYANNNGLVFNLWDIKNDGWSGDYNTNKYCMKERNIEMVKACDIAIILWNGEPKSGTAHFIKECEKINKKRVIIDIKQFIY